MRTIIALILGSGLFGGVTFGQEKEEDPFNDKDWHMAELIDEAPETWEVMWEVFSVPFSEAAKLRRETGDSAKIYGELVKRVEAEKAVLEEFVVLKGSLDEECETDSIEEYIHMTEVEPPELPNIVKKVPDNPEVAKMMMTPATPAAFDTKNLGQSLEMTVLAKAAPDVVEVKLSFNRVLVLGRISWGQGLSMAEMPEFQVQKIQKSVFLKARKPTLVGTLSPTKGKQEDGNKRRVWLAFATATSFEK